jgi:ribosomal protein S18 acetylase RimI-like enzyme
LGKLVKEILTRKKLNDASNGGVVGTIPASPTVLHATSPEHLKDARRLFQEYASTLGVDLCFQDFERELEELPGEYSEPNGCILLAFLDSELAGCVALRPFSPGICEMKRMYVRPMFRGKGIGRTLAQAVITEARDRGYGKMRLDSLPTMKEAQSLYRSLGFREIGPYRPNPIQGAVYMELTL